MANKNNATCSICGNPYYVCMSCKDSVKTNPWKIHTDTSEHYKVFQIIRGLSTGVYDKNEAKIKLNNVDLSDIDSFRPHIKELIEEILTEPDTKFVEKENTVEVLIAEEIDKVIDAIETEDVMVKEENVIIEDVDNIEEIIMPHKRNYKTKNEIEELE